MSTAPDLAALEAADPWEHFGTLEADALVALRARMGASYAATPSDVALKAALRKALAYLEGATARIFLPRAGTLAIDGTGIDRLFLPLPIVASSQLEGGGVTAITIGDDETAIDADAYVVSDGVGLPGRDPRDHPHVELVTPGGGGGGFVSRPFGFGRFQVWPFGVRNVRVTATWGYVDETGQTPELAREVLAKLTIRALAPNDDPDALDDLQRGTWVSEATRDRSVSVSERAGGGGVTTDREIDLLLARLRAPPRVRVTRGVARRRPRDPLLGRHRS